jgi:hypothetical protein
MSEPITLAELVTAAQRLPTEMPEEETGRGRQRRVPIHLRNPFVEPCNYEKVSMKIATFELLPWVENPRKPQNISYRWSTKTDAVVFSDEEVLLCLPRELAEMAQQVLRNLADMSNRLAVVINQESFHGAIADLHRMVMSMDNVPLRELRQRLLKASTTGKLTPVKPLPPMSHGPEATRDEHLAWCKFRAFRILDEVKAEDSFGAPPERFPEPLVEKAIHEAWQSFSSDMQKHPGTQDHGALSLGLLGLMSGHYRDERSLRDFIDGFN